MDKEELKAYAAYPDAPARVENSGDINYDQALRRQGFIKGYAEASKDNGPTWKDMHLIEKLCAAVEKDWLEGTPWDGIKDGWFYKEVLRRYQETKGNK